MTEEDHNTEDGCCSCHVDPSGEIFPCSYCTSQPDEDAAEQELKAEHAKCMPEVEQEIAHDIKSPMPTGQWGREAVKDMKGYTPEETAFNEEVAKGMPKQKEVLLGPLHSFTSAASDQWGHAPSELPASAQNVLDDLEATRKDKENEKARIQAEKDFSAEIGSALLADLEAQRKKKERVSKFVSELSTYVGAGTFIRPGLPKAAKATKEALEKNLKSPFTDPFTMNVNEFGEKVMRRGLPKAAKEALNNSAIYDNATKKWSRPPNEEKLLDNLRDPNIPDLQNMTASEVVRRQKVFEDEVAALMAETVKPAIDVMEEMLKPDALTDCGQELSFAPVGEAFSGTQIEIVRQCSLLQNMLVSKNKKYGDSLFKPPGVFSDADTLELINSRLDDKLVRLKQGDVTAADRAEDEEDIIGYLILKRVFRALEGK